MRFAIVAIAVTWSVALVVAQCWSPQPRHHAAHPNHTLAAAMGAGFAVNVDHAHISDNSMPPCPLDLATASLQRSETIAFGSDPVAASASVASVQHRLVRSAGRGPPGAPGSPGSGQDLLTRYCLARR